MKDFFIGCIDSVEKGVIRGWYCKKGDPQSFKFDVYIDEKKVNTFLANDYRQDLKEQQIHPTGLAGFEVFIGELLSSKKPEKLEIRSTTNNPIMIHNNPWGLQGGLEIKEKKLSWEDFNIYTCCSNAFYSTQDFRFWHLKATISSCIKVLNKKPILIVDPMGKSTQLFKDLQSEFEIEIIYTKFRFLPVLENYYPHTMQHIYSGAYLRFEIPFIDNNKYSMYVDYDVIFNNYFSPEALPKPDLLAASLEFNKKVKSLLVEDINSGVLIFNNKACRNIYIDLTDLLRELCKKDYPLEAHDQTLLKEFAKRNNINYTYLDQVFNWKPYWGINEKVNIYHFHGLKFNFLNDKNLSLKTPGIDTIYKKMNHNSILYYKEKLWDFL